jgi:hypothetical protein
MDTGGAGEATLSLELVGEPSHVLQGGDVLDMYGSAGGQVLLSAVAFDLVRAEARYLMSTRQAESVVPNSGEYADLALASDGRVCLAAENRARDAIAVYSDPRGQNLIGLLPGAFVGDRVYAMYPRMAANDRGQLACTYQRGPVLVLCLLGVTEIERPSSEEPFGTEMTCCAWIQGRWQWSYVARIFGLVKLVTRWYDAAGVELASQMDAADTTQGISRILPSGQVVTVDQDFLWPAYPNLSRPWQADDLVVGQGNDAPARALGYLYSGNTAPYRVFDGLAFRPRAVEVAPGQWTVISAGTSGIRVVDVPPFTLDVVEQPPIESLPVGTVIADTLPYVLGEQSRWARTGPDGTNMDCFPL